jgi:hypothetical protein
MNPLDTAKRVQGRLALKAFRVSEEFFWINRAGFGFSLAPITRVERY